MGVDTNLYPPIGLNSRSNIPVESEELTVIGFGALRQGGSTTPSQLQEVDVNYILSRTCNRGFWSYNGSVKDATMFCAGTGGGKDSCQGDSGGPIFTNREPIEQVGIVSWGRGCAQRRYPGVYSRVSGEFDWIKAQICSLASSPPAYLCGDNSPDVLPGNPSPPGVIGSPATRPPAPRPTRRPTPVPALAPAPAPEQSDPFLDFICSLFPFFC